MNKVILIGLLGQDPKEFGSETKVVKFSIAVSEKWKDKDGKPKEKTDWINVTAFGHTANVATKHLAKGSKVLVEGKIRTNEYTKEGKKVSSTEVQADGLTVLKSTKSTESHKTGFESEPQAGRPNWDDDEIPF